MGYRHRQQQRRHALSVGLLLLPFAVLPLGLVACAPAVPRPPAGTFTVAVEQTGWQKLGSDADPLSSHVATLAGPVVCSDARGYRLEDLDLELDTGACNYVSLQQSLPYALRIGDQLRVVLWHYPLASDPPATGHAALLLLDPQVGATAEAGANSAGLSLASATLLWERTVAIPKMADLYDEVVTLPRDAPVGAALVFHLHNHGVNQWRLQPLLIKPVE